MGGNIFTSASNDSTTVGGEVLSEFDTRFVDLLSDVLLNPKFAADDLEKLRANRLRELASCTQAGTLAWEEFRKTVFAGHPYADIYPEEAIVKSYKLDDVKSFYNNEYGAARTHLYVVGQFDTAKVRDAIEKAFGKWRKGP